MVVPLVDCITTPVWAGPGSFDHQYMPAEALTDTEREQAMTDFNSACPGERAAEAGHLPNAPLSARHAAVR
jgi:hypothetical protein